MSTDTPMTPQTPHQLDPSIFTSLQSKIDQDTLTRDSLKTIVDLLAKQSRLTQSILSRIHNTPTAALRTAVLDPADGAIAEQAATIKRLAEVAGRFPFYKWNGVWSREVQGVVGGLMLGVWLGSGNLVTIEEVGRRLNAPVNVKDSDTFHITIEEYLLALMSMIEELSRLAPNAVTLGDYNRPLQISRFIKDVHAGFQLLNLKNDQIRRKSDGLKYAVKKVEDVVYDLSLRGLIVHEKESS